MYRETVAFWAAAALNCVPIFNVGSIVMTIDPLSIFFWAAALLTLWHALELSPRFSWWWPLTGVLIGIGFLAKYTNAFQLFSTLFFLSVVPKYRGELRRFGFYSLLLCFLPFLLPPVIWNQQHDWITLEHLAARGGLDKAFRLRSLAFPQFLAGQLGVYSPLLYLGSIATLFASIHRSFRSSRVCYLLSFAWPLLAVYAVLALNKPGEPNWTAPAFLSLGVLSTATWLNWSRDRLRLRAFCFAGLVTGALMSLVTLHTDAVRAMGWRFPYTADPSARLRGWKSLTEQVEALRLRFEQKLNGNVFLIGNRYQTASLLSFYLRDKRPEGPGHPPVYIPESQDVQNEFSFWPRYDQFVDGPAPASNAATLFTETSGVNPFMDRSALFVTDRPAAEPPQSIQDAFTRWELIAIFSLERRRLPVRELRVFACYQYHTLPL
jgi:4-amino-4-deoxy-L-arabinose transferase-like glycosyltransferase